MKLGMPVDLGPGHIALDWNPAELPSSKRGRSPQFSTHICCGQMAGMRWMDQDATWQGSRHQAKRHCVRWGPSSPLRKGAEPPNFRPLVYCSQTAGWIKMPLGVEVGLGPCHIVLDWDPALPPQRCTVPQFSAHVCCGQTAGWIKMPLGRQVGLRQSDIVLSGDPAPLPKTGAEPPIFGRVYCSQTAGCIKMPLGLEVGLGPGHIVLDGDQAVPPQRCTVPAPIFGPYVLWPNGWMDQDATW